MVTHRNRQRHHNMDREGDGGVARLSRMFRAVTLLFMLTSELVSVVSCAILSDCCFIFRCVCSLYVFKGFCG